MTTIVTGNPRAMRACGHRSSERHSYVPWRVEGHVSLLLCVTCGRVGWRDLRPKGCKECLICKLPLLGRARNWCGNMMCHVRLAAYKNPGGWSDYVHYCTGTRFCRDCGAIGVWMEAHHVVPVSMGGVECDPDNGVLLCVDCHRERHRRMKEG